MSLTTLKPEFPVHDPPASETESISTVIRSLSLITHIEGGYFAETDRDPSVVPSPWPELSTSSAASKLAPQRPGFKPGFRNASTTIFYLLTPSSPQGNFHRNRARTVHTLHRGRGIYVLIHADEEDVEYEGGGRGKRIETFVVGPNVAEGEKLQWIVEGGKYKASFLLPDVVGTEGKGDRKSEGLLISETVVPGFEFCDHDFLIKDGLKELVGKAKSEQLSWLVRKE